MGFDAALVNPRRLVFGTGTAIPIPGRPSGPDDGRDFVATRWCGRTWHGSAPPGTLLPCKMARERGTSASTGAVSGLERTDQEKRVSYTDFGLATVVAIWMGGAILLVPLMALLARFGIAPVLDSIARIRGVGSGARSGGSEPSAEARLAEVETRVEELKRAVERLSRKRTMGPRTTDPEIREEDHPWISRA